MRELEILFSELFGVDGSEILESILTKGSYSSWRREVGTGKVDGLDWLEWSGWNRQ